MSATHDIFFSYRRQDLPRAQPLLDALDEAGVSVWRDRTNLADNVPITAEIRQSIAASKTLLAFYSPHYVESPPCQQEITAAWIAAQQMGRPPYERVLVINPEESFDHIPHTLSDQQSMGWPGDPAGFAPLAAKLRQHVDSLTGTLSGAASPATPAYRGMSPRQAARFVGRVSPMWQLHGQLTANRHSIITGNVGQATSQVRGLGGNGKSLLAREYAIRFGPAYPGGVFWLNAFGNDDAKGPLGSPTREALRQDQIRDFALQLGVATDGLSPEEVETAFWTRLEGNADPALWIVDDLPSGLDQAAIEQRWNARWPLASTLITTRSQEYGATGDHLDLELFTDAEAWQLLTSHRAPGDSAEEAAAREILAELGNHPLAVEVAGSYLAKVGQPFPDYLDDLRKPGEDILELAAELKESLPTDHERSIAATLGKSIRLLGAEGLDFLRLASILAVAPIPVRLLESVFERLDGEGSPKKRMLLALDQADTLNLCTKAGDDARNIHTLVSRTIRRQTGEDGRIAALVPAAQKALSEILVVVTDIRRHADVAREIVHARHVLAGGITSVEAAILGAWVGHHDHERADYEGARQLKQQVLESRQRLLGPEHPDTLRAMNNLAQTMQAQGDLPGARQLQEQVLESSQRLLGSEHPDTLRAKNNLAQMMKAQGDLPGARQLQEQVLEPRQRLLGPEHPDTLTAKNNLAQMMKAQGDLPGARQLQEQVLESRQRLLGPEHPDTLTAMNNLAGTNYAQGDLSGAQRLYKQVLESRQRLLGPEHPDTLGAMNNLAGTNYAQGDLSGAQRLYKQVLESSRRLLGPEHPDTLGAMNNLAQTMQDQGDLPGARQLQEQVLESRQRLLGPEHPDTLGAMNNLAQTMEDQGDLPGARQLQEQVLESRQRLQGPEHPDTLTAMNNLAQTMQDQGDLPGARQLQEQVLESRQRLLGPEHPDTLGAKNNLAQTMEDQGDLPGARQLQEQVLESRQRLQGPEHPDTLTAMNNLAQTMRDQGDLPGARQLQEQVLESRQRLLGAEHPDSSRAAWNLVQTLLASDDTSAALQVLSENLFWLLERDPSTLAGVQQQIREMLSKMLGGSGGQAG